MLSHESILGCCWGDRLNQPILITIVLLVFKLEDKKDLHEQVNSQWSALRGFNWQHSKSYVMPQPTDLFCHTIFLAKFNMLMSFSPHFLANMEGSYTPTWFSSGARAYHLHPKSTEGTFSKKFSWQIFMTNFGVLFYMGD